MVNDFTLQIQLRHVCETGCSFKPAKKGQLNTCNKFRFSDNKKLTMHWDDYAEITFIKRESFVEYTAGQLWLSDILCSPEWPICKTIYWLWTCNG